jgi:D-arabinose 1-dehydrogenase-like Zn-dependent alcohol dehydrogenase
MGMHVAAVDVGPEKTALARKLGAEIVIDAKTQDPPGEIQKQIGGAHGVLVTAGKQLLKQIEIPLLKPAPHRICCSSGSVLFHG